MSVGTVPCPGCGRLNCMWRHGGQQCPGWARLPAPTLLGLEARRSALLPQPTRSWSWPSWQEQRAWEMAADALPVPPAYLTAQRALLPYEPDKGGDVFSPLL